MKNTMVPLSTSVVASFLALAAVSATGAQPAADGPDRFSLGMRLGFNIDATFKNVGGYAGFNHPGPATGGGINRTYNDGFVGVDSSGNAGGLTWNWGYDQSSQISGDNLLLHSVSAPGGISSSQDAGANMGAELTYDRRIGRERWGSWGLEAAFNYTYLTFDDNDPRSGPANLLTDSYPLGGIVPPLAPYAGSVNGPGPLIGDSPTRSLRVDPAGLSVSGDRKLDASLYGFRLGPYGTFSLARYITLQLGGGLAIGVMDSRLAVSQTVSIGGAPVQTQMAEDSKCEVLVGAYADARIVYEITPTTSIFTGAQFQFLQDFTQQVGNEQADLGLGKTIFFTLGLSFDF